MKLLLILALLSTSQAYTAKCQSSYKQLLNVNTQIGLKNPDSLTMQNEKLVWTKEYYKNGKVKYEGYLNKNSIKVGIWTCYDSLGVKISECYWNPKGGKVNTPWKGTQIIWKDDLITGIENIDLGLLHGERLQFNESGNLIQRDTFKFDKLSGIRTLYYDNGNLREVDTFKYGFRRGVVRSWFENGQEEILTAASIQLIAISDTLNYNGNTYYLYVKIKNLTNKFQKVKFTACHDMISKVDSNQYIEVYEVDNEYRKVWENWVSNNEKVTDGNFCSRGYDDVSYPDKGFKITLQPNAESDIIKVRYDIDIKDMQSGIPIKIGLHPFDSDLIFWISKPVYFK
ncbi:MAG: hypothetical protein JNL74_03275 [Fibrobacteres bacterium]|nr:hypothetical protein [Fibrobacterota bacterium]